MKNTIDEIDKINNKNLKICKNLKKKVAKNKTLVKPSIKRIQILCEECLASDCSWSEFHNSCITLLKKEESMIKMLKNSKFR